MSDNVEFSYKYKLLEKIWVGNRAQKPLPPGRIFLTSVLATIDSRVSSIHICAVKC